MTPLVDGTFLLGAFPLSAQSLFAIAITLALICALFAFFGNTLQGKALRATAFNRVGARLVGISATGSGVLAFTLAALIGTVSGILIGSLVTIYYDTGFVIGLKGFVAAILGGLGSYPLAALGAVMVGLLEAVLLSGPAPSRMCSSSPSSSDPDVAQPVRQPYGGGRGMTARTALLGAFLLLCATGPLLLPDYYVTLMNYVGLGGLASLGLVLLTGIGGLTSFGQAAFVGIGAYTNRLCNHHARPLPVADPAAGAAGGRPVRLCHRRRDTAPVRPLPAPQHHRLEPVALFPRGQYRRAGRP